MIIVIILFIPLSIQAASGPDAFTSFSMGYYHLYNGDLQKAKSQFKLCLYYEEKPPSILFTILCKVSDWLDEKEEAKRYAAKGLEINPENEELLELYSIILLDEQNYKDALVYLKRLRDKKPYDLSILFSLAEVYDRLGDEDGLIDVYNRMVQINPSLVSAYLNLGYIYTKRAVFGLAEKEYQKVLELDPDNEKAIFYLTYIYLSTGKTGEALILFKKLDNRNLLDDEMLEDYAVNLFIEDQDPSPVLARIKEVEKITNVTKAITLFTEGNIDQAQKLFEKSVTEKPGSIVACIGLIRIAEKKKNIDMEKKWRFVLAGNYYNYKMFENALKEAKRVKGVDPHFIENRYLLGDIYQSLRLIEEAIAEYEYFAGNADEKGDVYIKLGILYDEIGKHEESIKNFLYAIELIPDNDELYYYLGLEYRIMKDYKNAIKAFKRAVELKEGDAHYYFNLGVSYERLGEISEAIIYLDKSVQLDDTNPVALNYLGYILADEGIRLGEAKDFIHKALSFDPENGAYLDSMGWVYYRMEDYGKAREYLEKAIEHIDIAEEENYLIYEHLGDVYYVLGLFPEASATWEKALKMKYIEEIEFKIKKAEEEMNR